MRNAAGLVGLVTATVTLGAACSAQPAGEDAARQADLERRTEARAELAKPLPERVAQESAAPVVGEVPDELMARIRADLAGRTGGDPAAFGLIRAESRTWNDGSLGCPRPGEIYTQALVPGYHVVLSYDRREYDYRVGAGGYLLLCPSPLPAPPPGATQTPR